MGSVLISELKSHFYWGLFLFHIILSGIRSEAEEKVPNHVPLMKLKDAKRGMQSHKKAYFHRPKYSKMCILQARVQVSSMRDVRKNQTKQGFTTTIC